MRAALNALRSPRALLSTTRQGAWWRVPLVAVGALALAVAAALCVALLCPTTPPSFAAVQAVYVPSDAWLLDRHGAQLDSVRVRFDLYRQPWTPLADVSPALVAAIVDGEDRRFWTHHGVDWEGAVGAVRDQALRNRRRGASTITMQLANLLVQRHRASTSWAAWTGKLAQIRLAEGLEAHWSKPQILEAYLNLLSYRGDLQGVAAAAQRLAGRNPASLSLPESMVLAALLPQPGASPARVGERACARATALGLTVSCDAIRAATSQLLAAHADPTPDHLAPQVAQQMLHAPGERLRTTLDAALQRLTRDTLRNHLAGLAARNVRDGAALVVDNATGEVLAYVGSAGPNSSAQSVDGVRAPRQAGSTLKPFLYELALERRYLTAASLLDDSPLNLETASGVYIPQDYDHDFKGLVSVRTALAGSLNVPAVRTLVLVGVKQFRDRLNALGYAGITQDGDFYGYSLALGSAEVTLWEQAQAYRTLARGGLWAPLTLTAAPAEEASGAQGASDGSAADRQVLPAQESFIVADILGDRAARAVTFGLDNHLNTPFWSAAKTGTSKDMRDNWCVGFSRRFTVAVWVGNFEGDAMHDVSGVTGAAPVWHDLMAALQQAGSAGDTSDATREAAPPAGLSSQQIHYSPAVEPARREWFVGAAPAARVDAVDSEGEIARIASPTNGMVIALDQDIPAAHQRVPISVSGAGSGMRLLLNDRLLGAANEPRLWAPVPGTYHLTLEDSSGEQMDRVLFTVRAAAQ